MLLEEGTQRGEGVQKQSPGPPGEVRVRKRGATSKGDWGEATELGGTHGRCGPESQDRKDFWEEGERTVSNAATFFSIETEIGHWIYVRSHCHFNKSSFGGGVGGESLTRGYPRTGGGQAV